MKKLTERDKAIGARIRLARLRRGMSQSGIAAALGTSYQQVQKYEAGHDRIAASTLVVIAKVLKEPVAWFFDGIEEPDALAAAEASIAESRARARSADALHSIPDGPVRRNVLALVEALAAQPAPAEAGA